MPMVVNGDPSSTLSPFIERGDDGGRLGDRSMLAI
jgi:hypothetical protein